MKRSIVIILLALVVAWCGVDGMVYADLNDGLVAYYPFNGNADDESGNGNNGTVNGATLTEDRFGNSDSAYNFDGIDDYIQVALSFDEDSDWTICAWINVKEIDSSYTDWQCLISDHANAFAIGLKTEDGQLKIWDSGEILSGTLAVTTNENFFICYQKISSTLNIFYNGLLNAFNDEGERVNFSLLTALGAWVPEDASPYNREPWNGTIDDVRIYNRALSESEIKELYNENVSGERTSLKIIPISSSDQLTACLINDSIDDINNETPSCIDNYQAVLRKNDNSNVGASFECDSVDELTLPFLSSLDYLRHADEVTLDNCSSANYRYTFTLPSGYQDPVLTGVANVDDMGVLYLNDHRISGELEGESDLDNDHIDADGLQVLNWPTPDSFSTDNSSYFKQGTNELIFSVAGYLGFSPTGIEFEGMVQYNITESFSGTLPETIQSYLVLTDDSAPCYVFPGNYFQIYGSTGNNIVNIKQYARAQFQNFIGENEINLEEASSEFTVYRSGATVYLNSTSGTRVEVAATEMPQILRFANGRIELAIIDDSVMLGSQLVGETESTLESVVDESDTSEDIF